MKEWYVSIWFVLTSEVHKHSSDPPSNMIRLAYLDLANSFMVCSLYHAGGSNSSTVCAAHSYSSDRRLSLNSVSVTFIPNRLIAYASLNTIHNKKNRLRRLRCQLVHAMPAQLHLMVNGPIHCPNQSRRLEKGTGRSPPSWHIHCLLARSCSVPTGSPGFDLGSDA